jgi:hypothetical protein
LRNKAALVLIRPLETLSKGKNPMKFACVLGLCGALMLAATSVSAGDLSPADAAIMRNYTLSMDKIRKYQSAMEAFNKAAAADPSLKTEAEKSGEEHDPTLAATEAKMMRHPRLMAFFTKQGLNANDVAVLPLVLMSASVAAQYPVSAPKLAPETSPAQIAFCKAHQAELAKMDISGDDDAQGHPITK